MSAPSPSPSPAISTASLFITSMSQHSSRKASSRLSGFSEGNTVCSKTWCVFVEFAYSSTLTFS